MPGVLPGIRPVYDLVSEWSSLEDDENAVLMLGAFYNQFDAMSGRAAKTLR